MAGSSTRAGPFSKPSIPEGLSVSESKVYEKLICDAEELGRRGQGPRPIVVIADVENHNSYNNLAALAVLKEFHRLRLVELRAVVANLMPTAKRPHLARAALDTLGLHDVPVARGSRGPPEEHEESNDEFGDFSWPAHVPVLNGQDLLLEVYRNAKKKDEKLHLLCLSSLQDIHDFASTYEDLVRGWTADVHMQGGNYISDGKLEPDSKAANNRFNLDAAKKWYSVVQKQPKIPSHTYIKSAEFVAPLLSELFVQLEATGHPIGAYLSRVHRIQLEQDVALYAALGVAGWDAVIKSEYCSTAVLSESQDQVGEVHRIRGSEYLGPALVMSSLLKGSLFGAVCDFCNGINFKAVGFRTDGKGSDEGKLFDIGTRQSRSIREVLQNRKRCMFCRKVTEYFRKWKLGKFDIQALDLQDERNWAYYELKSLEVDEEQMAKGRLGRLQVTLNVWSHARGASGLLLEFQKCSQLPLKVEDFCNSSRSLRDWESEEEPYSGRIRPLVADVRLFSKWIKACCDDAQPHPHCGVIIKGDEDEKWLTFMGLDGLRLIDVKNMCVVDDKGNMSYTALSYVWGSNTIDWPTLGYGNKNRYVQKNSLALERLPKTISDAIELTRQLEYGYIWIDCLCIMQDDDIDKRYFIPQMDVIFGCAVCTIIAASGDVNAGLPGIRPGSRTREQVPFMMKGVPLVRTLDPEGSEQRHSSFYGYLKDSEWCKRGWTFQEKLLSGRALIFTEEQVYFECQEGTWCEDGLWETMKPPTVYRHCFGDKDYCYPLKDSFERRYRKMVDEYSGRTLRSEKDRRDAFEGILQRFQWDAKRGQVFLWALPKMFLSNALTWRCEESCPVRRTDYCPVKPEFDKKITHCPFPSWSWLGWAGKVCFNASHGRLDTRTVDLIFYYFSGSKLLSVNQTGSTQSLSEMGIRNEGIDKTIVSSEDIRKSVDRYLVPEFDHQSNILFFWSSTAKVCVEPRTGGDLILTQGSCKGKGLGKVVPACFWFHVPTFPTSHTGPTEFEFVIVGKFVEYRERKPKVPKSVEKERLNRDKGLLAVLLVSWEDGVGALHSTVSCFCSHVCTFGPN